MPGNLPRLIRKNSLSPNPLWRVQHSIYSPTISPGSVIPKVARRVVSATAPSAFELGSYYYGIFGSSRTEPSRWTGGSFPAWYGADTPDTAMNEVLYHSARRRVIDGGGITALDGWREVKALLKAKCVAVLINVVGMEKRYPWLVNNDYKKCQELGRYIHEKNLLGIRYPSARSGGVCAAIYRQDVLSEAEVQSEILLGYNGTELEVKDIDGNLLVTRPL